jgi:hypothetical protein
MRSLNAFRCGHVHMYMDTTIKLFPSAPVFIFTWCILEIVSPLRLIQTLPFQQFLNQRQDGWWSCPGHSWHR